MSQVCVRKNGQQWQICIGKCQHTNLMIPKDRISPFLKHCFAHFSKLMPVLAVNIACKARNLLTKLTCAPMRPRDRVRFGASRDSLELAESCRSIQILEMVGDWRFLSERTRMYYTSILKSHCIDLPGSSATTSSSTKPKM